MVDLSSTVFPSRFLILFGLAAVMAGALTGLMRRYAISRAILDIPNARSSHAIPTPRGGGAAVVFVVLSAIAMMALQDHPIHPVGVALGVGGLLVAGVGWVDDRRGVPAAARGAIHVIAASWAIWALGGLPSITVGPYGISVGVAGVILGVLGIAWSTNLYNFMDGIDGIAGAQAVTAGVFGGIILLLEGQPRLATYFFLIGGAAAGFLFWNWSPAKIFLGDVGSGTLGFAFGCLAVAAQNEGAMSLLTSLLLCGPFVFDASFTLGRRAFAKARLHEAHRDHAYQRAVRSGLSHRAVAGAVTAMNTLIGTAAIAAIGRPKAQVWVAAAGTSLIAASYLAVEFRLPMKSGAPNLPSA